MNFYNRNILERQAPRLIIYSFHLADVARKHDLKY